MDPNQLYKSHELRLFSGDGLEMLHLKETSMAEPGNEQNTVNKFFRLELKSVSGNTNSRMVVVPQLAVHSKTGSYVVPVGWTLGTLEEAVVRIDGELFQKTQQLSGLEADYTDLIDTERTARVAQDTLHTNAINSEITTREQNDFLLSGRIIQEVNDRIAVNSAINQSIAANTASISDEVKRATSAEGGLALSLSNHRVDLDAADLALGGRITSEITDRKTADSALVDSLASEAKDRYDADQTLSARIDFITHNVSPGALDSLSEIVNKFNADGATYASRLTAIESVLAELLNR